jgi:hypothetical protein
MYYDILKFNFCLELVLWAEVIFQYTRHSSRDNRPAASETSALKLSIVFVDNI